MLGAFTLIQTTNVIVNRCLYIFRCEVPYWLQVFIDDCFVLCGTAVRWHFCATDKVNGF